jgi:hypothetical protein
VASKKNFEKKVYCQSRAPSFHSIANPTVRIARKTLIDQNPRDPRSWYTTLQGNRKEISRSKRRKRMATR